MKQSWWVFTGAMTTLGNITSGDNVMIKFPVRWIKMSKSWSTVTLSITEELNKDGYQYYAHSTGTLSNPWTPKDAFYLGSYKWYNNSNVLKSWSGNYATVNKQQSTFCNMAKSNWTWYNIYWWYQRMYIAALYMMKYGNPNSQSAVWMWYVWGSDLAVSWWTNSQTNATYGTSSWRVQCKLFWLEDRWGNYPEWVWWVYTDSWAFMVKLSWWNWYASWWERSGYGSWNGYMTAIWGYNEWMFIPQNYTSSQSYYCDKVTIYNYSWLAAAGGYYNSSTEAGIFWLDTYKTSDASGHSARLMYMNWLT
jgi:hypothetical protein